MHSYDDKDHLHLTPKALQDLVKQQNAGLSDRLAELAKQSKDNDCEACAHDVPLQRVTTDELKRRLDAAVNAAAPSPLIVHVDDVGATEFPSSLDDGPPERTDRAARRARARGRKPR